MAILAPAAHMPAAQARPARHYPKKDHMAQEVKPQEPIRNSNAKGSYDGKELAPFEGRPGAMDAYRLPSLRLGSRVYPK